MKKKFSDYLLGVDIGTDSVGFAITDLNYNLMKLNGKSIWGVRLFDSGNPAAERRLFRCARRRLERRVQRIKLLQELMAVEICKTDPAFFHRLNESMYHLDDKTGYAVSLNTLFNDKNYTDKDYHKEFPTIFHLRKALIDGRQLDVRFVYLALAHIIKHRGHFLFEGQKFDTTPSFELIFNEINTCLIDEFEFKFNDNDKDKLADILKKKGIFLKKKEINLLINNPSSQQKEILNLLVGGKVNLIKIFGEEIFADSDIKPEINFSDSGFEDKLPELASMLQDKIYIIEALKRAYDWGVLADILQGENYLSYAKVKVYEKHKKDLHILKGLVKKYLPKEKYQEIFSNVNLKDNYVAYVSVNKHNDKKEVVENGKCSQEDFNKYLRKQFEQVQNDDSILFAMREELEQNSFMPKQTSKDNGVIPYQVHLSEMKVILNNAIK
ncbi:MAG: type II CRISPR RNA-guided endonuclease Cas9, partial [bacterium]